MEMNIKISENEERFYWLLLGMIITNILFTIRFFDPFLREELIYSMQTNNMGYFMVFSLLLIIPMIICFGAMRILDYIYRKKE
jgi:lipid-A-disaccharide synthase-like uncharacterized protein